jgi:hypothetical protein
MRRAAEALLWATVASVLMCAAQPSAETTVRLKVPKQVAAQQTARAAGNASAPSPVLMLEDVEVGADEGLTIQILGPAKPGSSEPRPVLGVAATVGQPQKVLKGPVRRMTLAVPLNDKASRLLAGKSEVTLVLQVEDSAGRPPLKFKRAYFDGGEPEKPPHR